jgi:hypothetical protein
MQPDAALQRERVGSDCSIIARESYLAGATKGTRGAHEGVDQVAIKEDIISTNQHLIIALRGYLVQGIAFEHSFAIPSKHIALNQPERFVENA